MEVGVGFYLDFYVVVHLYTERLEEVVFFLVNQIKSGFFVSLHSFSSRLGFYNKKTKKLPCPKYIVSASLSMKDTHVAPGNVHIHATELIFKALNLILYVNFHVAYRVGMSPFSTPWDIELLFVALAEEGFYWWHLWKRAFIGGTCGKRLLLVALVGEGIIILCGHSV